MNRPRVSPVGQAVSLATGLAFGLLLSVQASAQSAPATPWLPDRQYQEGPGIKVGKLELHPGIAIRGGYDTNVFRADGEVHDGVRRKEEGAGILAISPHLFLTTQTAQRAQGGEDRGGPPPVPFLTFKLGVAAHYLHYFIKTGPRDVGAEADLFLGIAQNRVVGIDISADYTRSVPPFTQNAGSRRAYVFDSVQPRLRLNFRSRSQVVTSYVGYAPKYTHYESSTFDYLNNIQHNAEAGAAWRFLPSTALVYDAGFAYQDYTRFNRGDRDLLILSTNKIFRNRLGVNGALTNNLALRVLAGYAVGFFNNRELDDFEDGIGEAVLTYRFDPHVFEVGYQRDIQSSPIGSWYQTDRGFAKLGLLFARVFALGFEAGAGYARYGRMIRYQNDTSDVVTGLGVGDDRSRTDVRVDGAVRAEYRATNWLAFMADFVVQSVITDFDFAVNSVPDPNDPGAPARQIPDPADYTTYQIFGGVRAHY